MREIKFRLRMDDRIVGYEKWYRGERAEDETKADGSLYWRASACWLYSKDGNNWTPTLIFHNKKDSDTGLKDKNDTEIYEGDIVWFAGTRQQIYYDAPTFRMDDFGADAMYGSDMKVIGNIYENKELLEVK